MLRNNKVAVKPTAATRTYTVAKEGFLLNTYRKVGDKVSLLPKQATYLIHSGQLANPDAKRTVKDRAHAAFAAAGKST